MFESTVLDAPVATQSTTQPPLGYDETVEDTIDQVEAQGAVAMAQQAAQQEPPVVQKSGTMISAQILRNPDGTVKRGPKGGVLVGAVLEANLELPLKYEKVDPKTKKVEPLKQTTYASGAKGTGAADKNGIELEVSARVYVRNPIASAAKALESIF